VTSSIPSTNANRRIFENSSFIAYSSDMVNRANSETEPEMSARRYRSGLEARG
jgi:hypothetical protein